MATTELKLEHPPLRSLTEAANTCAGWGDEECGDEIPKGTELCPRHQHEENKHYEAIEREREEEETIRNRSQYSHLR